MYATRGKIGRAIVNIPYAIGPNNSTSRDSCGWTPSVLPSGVSALRIPHTGTAVRNFLGVSANSRNFDVASYHGKAKTKILRYALWLHPPLRCGDSIRPRLKYNP